MRKKFVLIPSYMFESKKEAEERLKKIKRFNENNFSEFPYLSKIEYEIRNISKLKSGRVGKRQFKFGIYFKQ